MSDDPIPAFTACPVCGYEIETPHECLDKSRAPQANDVTMCCSCGEPLMLTEKFTLRLLELDDMLAMPERFKQRLMRAQAFIRRERPLDKKR